MSRASEDLLAQIHGLVGRELIDALNADEPSTRMQAIDRALKFLKDNSITATVDASVPLQELQRAMPTADELEKLMTMTPD
jgi:hypothetical protein